MPSYCIVCDFSWQRNASTSFHKFNFDREEILNKWIEFVRKCKGQAGWIPSKWSSLCNKHFLPTDFKQQKGVLRKHLNPDAVPTIEITQANKSQAPPATSIESYQDATPPPLIISTKPTPQTPVVSESPAKVINSISEDQSITGSQCRFCAKLISPDKSGVNIFTCPSLNEWTAKFLGHLNILPSDTLTKSVCPPCYQQMEKFNHFSENAIKSQTILCAKNYSPMVASTGHHNYHRTSLDLPRGLKIKQEPIVNIKEEALVLNDIISPTTISNSELSSTTITQTMTEDFSVHNNLSSLLSDFCHYNLESGHIMEITDLTNDFINLTGEDEDDSNGGINIKPNIVSPMFNAGHFKQEEEVASEPATGLMDDYCLGNDEEFLSKGMISDEHSYCKFSLHNLLDGNILRTIKTEKKEPEVVALPGPSSQQPIPLVTIPKIYIIDNALIKHDCDRCGGQFETRSMLIDHQKRVHRFLCPLCNTRCLNFSSFYFHKLNCSYRRGYLIPARKYWQCKECLSQFKLQLGYRNHLKRRICRKILSLRRNGQRRRWLWNKQVAVQQQQQQEKYSCDTCNKTFLRRSNMNQHRLSHTAQRTFACPLCDKVFKRSCGLSAHHRSFHLKLRPFQCDLCLRRFALKADMRRCKHSGIVHEQQQQAMKQQNLGETMYRGQMKSVSRGKISATGDIDHGYAHN